MAKYIIEITETLQKQVMVEAESKEEAIEKVEDDWISGVYILGAEDFVGADFTCILERADLIVAEKSL